MARLLRAGLLKHGRPIGAGDAEFDLLGCLPFWPFLHLDGFGIAIKRAFKVPQCDDKAGPPVKKTELEDIVLQKGPSAVRRAVPMESFLCLIFSAPSVE